MTTVLFVHGLESGPRGKKAQALEQAGFTVVAGQMPCGRRAIARDPVVIALALVALGGLIAAASRGATGFLIAVTGLAVVQRYVRPLLTRRMFRRSVEVQRALLAANQVDVVVGSSFGGAVSLELLRSGAWKGPTVLLCPAHRLVAGRAWLAAPSLPADASRVVVVHGRQDETVPLDHSRSLVKGTAAKLIEVDDGHRLAATATPENFAKWIRSTRE
jgi:pimeloyl-ACP methyl ester carboxylesterase